MRPILEPLCSKIPPGRVKNMSDVKNICVVGQNTNEVYVVQFLARLVEKRQNEKEKSLGGGNIIFPPPATQHCVEDL